MEKPDLMRVPGLGISIFYLTFNLPDIIFIYNYKRESIILLAIFLHTSFI